MATSLVTAQARKREIENDLAAIRAQIRTAISAPASFSVAGSYSENSRTVADLHARESKLERQLAILNGVPTRTTPDFSGGETE
jgi:hypothetical protein